MAQIIIPGGTQTVPTVSDMDSVLSKEGAQTITAGFDLSALLTGVTNFSVYSAINTTAANPFHMTVIGTYRHAGMGTIHVRPVGTGADDINRAIQSGTGTSHFLTGGAVDTLEVLDGRAIIEAAVDVNTIYQTGGNIVQYYNATENDSWTIMGGTFNTERGMGGSGIIGENATVVVKKRNTDNTPPVQDTGALTVLGTLVWNGGNIATINIYGEGYVDLRGVDQDITITTLNATAEARQRSILESKNPDVTITIGTENIFGGETEADGKTAMGRSFSLSHGA